MWLKILFIMIYFNIIFQLFLCLFLVLFLYTLHWWFNDDIISSNSHSHNISCYVLFMKCLLMRYPVHVQFVKMQQVGGLEKANYVTATELSPVCSVQPTIMAKHAIDMPVHCVHSTLYLSKVCNGHVAGSCSNSRGRYFISSHH